MISLLVALIVGILTLSFFIFVGLHLIKTMAVVSMSTTVPQLAMRLNQLQ